MNRKMKLVLVAFILITIISSASTPAFDRGGDNAITGSGTAGVAGAGDYIVRVSSVCIERDCIKIRKQIDQLNEQIEDKVDNQFKSLNTLPEDLEKDFNAILNDSNYISETLNKINVMPVDNKGNKKKKAEKREAFIKDYCNGSLENKLDQIVEQKAKIIEEYEKTTPLEDWRSELEGLRTQRNGLVDQYKEVEKGFLNTSYMDSMLDVIPENTFRLESGDLIAWGIPHPGIPSIPRPKPKQEPPASNPADQQPQASDETYNALRQVEQISDKVTDTEKDQFIQSLDQRAQAGN
ncbi:MAG: hypothetical protein AB1782_02065 [Cyanobacteriota bacterium]